MNGPSSSPVAKQILKPTKYFFLNSENFATNNTIKKKPEIQTGCCPRRTINVI